MILMVQLIFLYSDIFPRRDLMTILSSPERGSCVTVLSGLHIRIKYTVRNMQECSTPRNCLGNCEDLVIRSITWRTTIISDRNIDRTEPLFLEGKGGPDNPIFRLSERSCIRHYVRKLSYRNPFVRNVVICLPVIQPVGTTSAQLPPGTFPHILYQSQLLVPRSDDLVKIALKKALQVESITLA